MYQKCFLEVRGVAMYLSTWLHHVLSNFDTSDFGISPLGEGGLGVAEVGKGEGDGGVMCHVSCVMCPKLVKDFPSIKLRHHWL